MSDDKRSWKDNHVFVSLMMITLVTGGLGAIGNLSGMYDSGHTSEAELDVVRQLTLDNSIGSECRWLDIKITLAENAIWSMEQVATNGQRLVEMKRELRNLTVRYADLHCATILSR